MKTQNVDNKLKFDKKSISELNDDQLTGIHGGSVAVGFTIGWSEVVMPLPGTAPSVWWIDID